MMVNDGLWQIFHELDNYGIHGVVVNQQTSLGGTILWECGIYHVINILHFMGLKKNGIYRHLVGCEGMYMDFSSFPVFFFGM